MSQKYVCKCGHDGIDHTLRKPFFRNSPCHKCDCKDLKRTFLEGFRNDNDYRVYFISLVVIAVATLGFGFGYILYDNDIFRLMSLVSLGFMFLIIQVRMLERREKILKEACQ